jgi:hypothetical protein
MKKLIVLLMFFWGFSVMANAQDVRPIEIFGGYSYAYFNGVNPGDNYDIDMNGWIASLTINKNSWVGFVANFGGIYKTVPETAQKFKIHNMLFGPKFTARMGKVSPFAQILLGTANLNVIDLRSEQEDYCSRDFSMSLGGGMDLKLNNLLDIRLAQVEYYGIRDGESGEFIYNFSYSGGIVFKVTLDQF